jgi:hypothetical protein
MRLINVRTLGLEEFYADIPHYAILSHTWSAEEVSFQDWKEAVQPMQDGVYWDSGDPGASISAGLKERRGCQKILKACERAYKDGLSYLWVDTNCIDKTSSAELSEAINSMFEWYRYAKVCYAYLADVKVIREADKMRVDMELVANATAFAHSRWFRRGWTLQELLAPTSVEFYDERWRFIGSLRELASRVSQITGISVSYFGVSANSPWVAVHGAHIGERMSWMTNRTTTRKEDMAYCLLGVFNINMPLLYGEGDKAFVRLQEELIRKFNDHTIFCWDFSKLPTAQGITGGNSGILTQWPSTFEESQLFRTKFYRSTPSPYTVTNSGLSITLPAMHALNGFFGFLNARIGPRGGERVAVALVGLDKASGRRLRVPKETYVVPTLYRLLISESIVLSTFELAATERAFYVTLHGQFYPWQSLVRISDADVQGRPMRRQDAACLTIAFSTPLHDPANQTKLSAEDQDAIKSRQGHPDLLLLPDRILEPFPYSYQVTAGMDHNPMHHSLLTLDHSAMHGAALFSLLSDNNENFLLFVAVRRASEGEAPRWYAEALDVKSFRGDLDLLNTVLSDGQVVSLAMELFLESDTAFLFAEHDFYAQGSGPTNAIVFPRKKSRKIGSQKIMKQQSSNLLYVALNDPGIHDRISLLTQSVGGLRGCFRDLGILRRSLDAECERVGAQRDLEDSVSFA